MKTLKDFILESNSTSKTITFDFSKFDDKEDVIKSLEEYEGVTTSENTVTITVNDKNYDKLDSVVDILQQYGDSKSKEQNTTTYEKIGNAVSSFNQNVAKLNDAIDEFEGSDEEDKKEEDDNKEGDDKKEDKEEEKDVKENNDEE